MNEAYFPPRLSGFFIFLLSSVILISSTIFIFFRPTTNIIPSQSLKQVITPVTIKTYTTHGSYNLTPEIIKSFPTLTLGNIQFTYPQTWFVQDVFKPSIMKTRSDVVRLGIYLTKSNLSNDLSAPDEPTKNMVMIDFSLKNTKTLAQPLNISLREMMMFIFDNFGYQQNVNFSYLISEGTVSGLPAQLLFRSVEEASTPQTSYPESILVAVSPTTVLDIEIGFFDSGKDKTYSQETIKEINEVLKSIKIIKNSPIAQADTSTWKTYTNRQLGIEFRYPNNWFIAYDHSNSVFVSSTDPKNGGNLAGFTVKKGDYSEYISYDYIRTRLQPVTVAGVSGLRWDSDAAPENIQPSEYFITLGDSPFTISLSEDIGFPERKEREINNQILSTFKFINQISPTSIPITDSVSACKTGGCSGELCLEAGSPDKASICLYRNEYACLKYSVCEKQPNGKCGWTQTQKYLSCLKNLSPQTPPSF